MKAIIMTASGTPSVLKLADVPTPQIKNSTDVLIKIKAAGVNPIDTKIRSRGSFFPDQMPCILGCDGAGIVEAIGDRVTNFKIGDEVYYCEGGLGKKGMGNYAQYAVIDETLLAHKPQSLSFEEAAAAPLVLITAWEALFDRARLKAGQTLLIQGGAGGVGHVAIQLAKIKGAKIATTISTSNKEKLVRLWGADYPILYKQTDFIESILNWTDGKGVDIAFDTIGGDLFFKTCSAVKIYGDLVTILEPQLGTFKEARNRNLRISLELMLTPALKGVKEAQIHQVNILKECAKLIDQGQLKIHLSQTFPLEKAHLAHEAIEIGSTTGKIALLID